MISEPLPTLTAGATDEQPNYSAVMSGGHLEATSSDLEAVRIDALHLDVLDGAFSPSMPLGRETIRRPSP